MKFNILLIGSGGREHALALALVKSKSCGKLFAAPANPGILELAQKANIDIQNPQQIIDFCKSEQITLVVVGPEQPLAEGISDILSGVGITVFGPSKYCAQLETSKDFAKRLMFKHNIPTASFRTFKSSESEEAHKYIETQYLPLVLKADGLAAGKGVVIAETYNIAHNTIDDFFGGQFGEAGSQVVIEEFMEGEEASIFVVTDGADFIILPPAQDHKRIGNNDEGKNTGGMGAFAPANIASIEVIEKVENIIIKPILKAFSDLGHPYRGLLYIGLMIKDMQPKVVEFNVRFGDPETQAVLPLVEGDFAKLFYTAAIGNIDKESVTISNIKHSVCIVLASGGYPDKFEKGFEIEIPGIISPDEFIYHAGTTFKEDHIVTNGGRVLGVTAVENNLSDAIAKAYLLASKVRFENIYYRRDIGNKGLKSG